ncbi:hypothetical protein KAM472_33040 [Aeromonas caviae]|uniref:ketol-acid reductoisomerase n=1 Tax=Aeromonas caviae TaxID=648 RepID=UPI001FB869A4|nr:ketol-acid reductoisomerase [Aeromonas caviae]GKR41608.1 hypothetical protein KAM472_33040 [Aeromonas caviae]
MANYFNTLNLRQQLAQLGKCRFMQREEFADGCNVLKGKKVVIVGCGAQGLNQGLNMRDSGLDISYALRKAAITEKRASWQKATDNGFVVGTYEELIPTADLVLNLTPDKQHSDVVKTVMPLMKQGAALGYSHGFNVVEEGQQIRSDITVVMVAPKCPGTEVREEYKRGFGVPTLIAVHPENDPQGEGMAIAKAWASATGGDRAGVLESSFVAEVKSDLMGEQTILCGMLQAGSLLCYDKLVAEDTDPAYAGKIAEQEYFDNGVVMVAMVKAGVELAFETMVASGIYEESAYYESLHELPLIANTVARKRLYEMNVVISDTAEYGNYLFANAAVPLLREHFMPTLQAGDLGSARAESKAVDNLALLAANEATRNHPIEKIGQTLRGYMKDMKRIAVGG